MIKTVAVLIFILLAVVLQSESHAQWIEEEDIVSPLVDSEPFGILRLNDKGENAILKVVELSNYPAGELPRKGDLVFEYADGSSDLLQVPYESVEGYQSFNELLIDEANAWLTNKEYAKAFRNFLHVYDNGGRTDSSLVNSLRACMFQDGLSNFQNGRYELALSIYEDIYRRDPTFEVDTINKPLIEIVMACYDGMIQNQFDAEDYLRVQLTLKTIQEKYQEGADSLSAKWSAAFVKKADDLMELSRKYAAEGKGRDAHLASRQAEQMTPGRAEVKELQEEILAQFPLVVVGVSQSGGDADPRKIADWGSRRVGRMTKRMLIELTGLTDEGGKYQFPNGELYQADEIGMKYVFEIKPDPNAFGIPPISAFEVSSRILSVADENSPEFDIGLRKVLKDVEIEGQNKVIVNFRKPFVRPEALFNILYNRAFDDEEPVQDGIYIKTRESEELSTFELNPAYPRIEGRQHPVVVEQLYRSSSEAVDELIKGNIDVVDLIPPADVRRLKKTKGIVVRPYILPTVHMLVPKIRGELKDNLDFRNGLSTAINREMLVSQAICDGNEIPGCETISGPFPLGTDDNDQIAYGYDFKIRSLPFNEKLAMVRLELARRPTKKRKQKLPAPSLVIAYPRSSAAREGAAAIARMWTAAGIQTSTRELPAGDAFPQDELWDFLYLQVTMQEPLTDITDIIGQTGFARGVNPTVEQTMRAISYANSWRTTCGWLRRLHRQVSVDLSVIPLWQVVDHYAYRNTVRGVGRDLIHLYQNVDRWEIDVEGKDEEE